MIPYSGFLSLIAGKYVSISGKLLREKTIANLGKIRFSYVCGLLVFAAPKIVTSPNFVKKTFVNSHKTMEFVKVYSLKSFPLYSSKY